MRIRAHVFVGGRVQGVFFRSETSRLARKCNVNGWIRNLPNGRVEVVVEGDEESVKQLITYCRHGPEGAEVTNVDVSWEQFTGEFRSFEIRYE